MQAPGQDWLVWILRAALLGLIVWLFNRVEVDANRLTKLEAEHELVMQKLFDRPSPMDRRDKGSEFPR